ncbi:uncharacterized protein PV06_01280 [Exophiala oligosperma]|uniref:DUF6594 domain-containing protein n=1 Tax=Exophiala oligosperma TaxID=215243 RepID=A0A0D2E1Q4_9EURO|nr:uncharacterized protein PV06_01280 [Exophiala oligosperma]KIW48715.1 hypothetical protein PV06_01280 [Exophiala oligosperma]
MLGSASMSDGTIYEHPIPDLEQQKVKSWRYIGYRGFSEWSASAQDFLVVRRFDSLAARVIFLLQWEITKLESGLTEMDEVRMYGAKDDLNNGSFECDDEDRQFQIKTIKAKLEDYYSFITAYSALRVRGEASATSKGNVDRWLRRYRDPIAKDEIEFIREPHHPDLFSVAGLPRTLLRRVLEKLHVFHHTLFRTLSHHDPAFTEGAIHYADKRVDGFVNLVICITGFMMLAVPLWILYILNGKSKEQLIVIAICIGVFLATVQAVSVAKPFESLAATAAYSAVLMVFMQIGP